MFIIKGNDLKQYIENRECLDFKRRFVFNDLMSEIKNHREKLIALYGLRRTGKTSMIYQAINEINDYDKCTFIQCYKNDTIDDLFEYLQTDDSKYFFIDEITFLKDFIEFSNCLSDNFINKNRKIIMSGTDSLGFDLASKEELYDRITMFHTTYISYREYKYLLDKDIFDYMRYGGTLSDENVFYNEKNTNEYTNTAITSNILNTYKYWYNEDEKSIFKDVSKQDMTSFINRIIRKENIKFITDVLTEKFKASELGSVKQMYKSKIKTNKLLPKEEQQNIPNPDILSNPKLINDIRDALFIKDEHDTDINNELVTAIKYNLLKLDVIKRQDDTFYLVQPGMRYCHIKAIVDTLKDSEIIKENYNDIEQELIYEKIMQDIEGHLLENICITDLQEYYKLDISISVDKFKPNIRGEFDIVLKNKINHTAIVIEVKRSSKAVQEQKKWLNDNELRDAFELTTGYNIVGRYVLYNGNNLNIDNDNVIYKNMSDFLYNPMNNINVDFPLFYKISNEPIKNKDLQNDKDAISLD